MRKFSRLFVCFLFVSLSIVYAPMTQADMQQGYGDMAHVPASGADELQQQGYGGKVGNKAMNAFANLTTGVLEIPKNIINTTNKSNIFYGVVGGLFKGLVHTGGRIGSGIADLVTIPLPTKPIAQPRYIWENFDVDTTYGPVFRLDETKETERPAVQAPSVEPVVAAPPVVAPVDRSAQYRMEEDNRKRDALFKDKMTK
ncbi:MAG: exosortase system-associated protein, TIGR04073 family [Methylobacter tundripaludum]|nr:exosortase system-associated protein, TIGR04073 family [Methylobacter tundripaludum]